MAGQNNPFQSQWRQLQSSKARLMQRLARRAQQQFIAAFRAGAAGQAPKEVPVKADEGKAFKYGYGNKKGLQIPSSGTRIANPGEQKTNKPSLPPVVSIMDTNEESATISIQMPDAKLEEIQSLKSIARHTLTELETELGEMLKEELDRIMAG